MNLASKQPTLNLTTSERAALACMTHPSKGGRPPLYLASKQPTSILTSERAAHFQLGEQAVQSESSGERAAHLCRMNHVSRMIAHERDYQVD